jgi:hypothetical protein
VQSPEALAVGGVRRGLAVEGLVGVNATVLELTPHLLERQQRGNFDFSLSHFLFLLIY